jgi:hypothetical protein
MGVTQLLQQAGPRTAALEALLQQEVADLAGNQQRLNLVRHLLHNQHQQNVQPQRQQHDTAPAASLGAGQCSSFGSSSNSKQLGRQPIRVLPLLGLTLSQLVAHLQQQLQQQQDSANARILPLDATPLMQAGGTPLAAAFGHSSSSNSSTTSSNGSSSSSSSSSPFLLALHAEVQRLRQLVACCYVQLEETVAAIGQQLPPVQDSSSSSEGGEAAAAMVTAGRRSVRVSNSDSLPLTRQPSLDAGAAAAYYAAGNNNSSSTSTSTSSKLDIEFLQARAAAVSHDLVHLDDFVSSSITQLAQLAIQYDTLLTAAATDCAAGSSSRSSSCSAGNAAAGAGVFRAASLMGLLGKRHQPASQQQQQQQGGGRQQQAVQFLLMTPGVCSHSSSQQACKYIAGGS